MLIWPKNFLFTIFEYGYRNNAEFFEKNAKNVLTKKLQAKNGGKIGDFPFLSLLTSIMQIRKKWLNQLKKILNKHLNEYYLASFCWWIFSSCENHCIHPIQSLQGVIMWAWILQRTIWWKNDYPDVKWGSGLLLAVLQC